MVIPVPFNWTPANASFQIWANPRVYLFARYGQSGCPAQRFELSINNELSRIKGREFCVHASGFAS